MFEFVNQVFNRAEKISLTTVACITVVLATCGEISLGQSIQPVSVRGTPRVIHYTRADFKSDPQIWAMCQDKHGILYFGSNKGALIFDGEQWQTVRLPNNSSVRSLAVNSEGLVFAGGFNEFGTIRRDVYGRYFYESWIDRLRPEDRNIENVWAIHEVQGHMVFRSYRLLIAIARNRKAITLPTTGLYEYSAVLNDSLFVYDGLSVRSVDLLTSSLSTVFTNAQIRNESLLALLPGTSSDHSFAITREGAFFEVDIRRNAVRFLERIQVGGANNLFTTAIRTSSGRYYLGTLTSKVIFVDLAGAGPSRAQVFHDLQDNTVHNLFESREGNIWALLNNGIDCIDVNAPVTLLLADASVFDVLFHQGKVFVATNQGVFDAVVPADGNVRKEDFMRIPGMQGQAWSLAAWEGRVVVSHDQGVFVLENSGWKKLPGARGIWKTMAIEGKPHHYFACTYDGLFLIRFDEGKGFQVVHKVEGFNESSRDILQADQKGVFWVCHGYKGVFRIKVDDEIRRLVSLEHFRDENGLPSPFNINVRRWNDAILFTTNRGIYTYDDKENRFVIFAPLTKLFGLESNIRQLAQSGEKTWFVQNDEVGYFNTREVQPQLYKGLFLQLKGTLNESMECIVPVNEQNVLVGTREGLYAFDLRYRASTARVSTLLTSFRYRKDSTLHNAPVDREPMKLSYGANAVTFTFAVPDFDDRVNTQYSYRMEGIADDWSEWDEKSYAEFAFLPPGKYNFRVRGRSLIGETAAEASCQFEILPAWYRTTWAYIVYGVASLLVLLSGVKSVHRRIDHVRRKTRIEEEEKRRLLQLELDRMKLQREKAEIIRDKVQLEEDVIYKSKELANYTMLLVKKRELLAEMNHRLTELREVVRNDQARHHLRDLQKKIQSNLQSEEHLRVFESNFERVHQQFFSSLKAAFPDLSAKELQLCAFVKMNLTNKEIASILNLSVRGIETARYRLRKRLGIGQDEDMAEFLERLYMPAGVSAN